MLAKTFASGLMAGELGGDGGGGARLGCPLHLATPSKTEAPPWAAPRSGFRALSVSSGKVHGTVAVAGAVSLTAFRSITFVYASSAFVAIVQSHEADDTVIRRLSLLPVY